MVAHPLPMTPNGSEVIRLNATIQDLVNTPHDGCRYELLKGVLLRMPPPQEAHGLIGSFLIEALAPYCRTHHLRSNLVTDIGYELQWGGNAPIVLAPDVSIFRIPKAAGVTYSPDAPLLAVEIASPSQSHPYFNDKAEYYLFAGTSMVWVVWPATQTVDVWTPPATSVILSLHDTLDGGTVLPGLSIAIADIFS